MNLKNKTQKTLLNNYIFTVQYIFRGLTLENTGINIQFKGWTPVIKLNIHSYHNNYVPITVFKKK